MDCLFAPARAVDVGLIDHLLRSEVRLKVIRDEVYVSASAELDDDQRNQQRTVVLALVERVEKRPVG